MRADKFLFEKGLAKSRSHAAALIKDGVCVGLKRIEKPSQDIAEDTPVCEIKIENPSRYVSRGGIKLEAALFSFQIFCTQQNQSFPFMQHYFYYITNKMNIQ